MAQPPFQYDSTGEHPLVSVLMSTRDRLDLLPGALASVAAQTETRWELVLVNDGGPSPQGLVRRMNDPRVKLVEVRERRGKGHAINRAFAECKGRFVAHLDDDDAWLPEHLAVLVDVFRQDRSVRFVHSDAERVDQEPDGLGGWRETGRSVPYSTPATLENLIEYNCVTGISVMHDRALFDEAGGMDEELDVLLDWDLWRRMAALTPPRHVSQITAEYFVRTDPEADSGHVTGLAQRDPVRYVQNRLRVLDKDIPLPPDGSLDEALAAARARGRMQLAVAEGERAEAAGDIDAARAKYAAARDETPADILPWRKLGRIDAARGAHAEALRAFGKCLALPGALPSDALHAAGAAMGLGAPDKALGVLDAAVRRFAPDDEGMGAIARLREQVRALAR